MKLLDYTTEAALLPRLVCPTLEQAVKRLAHALGRAGLADDAAALAGDVLRREEDGGTALPDGVVLTHARSDAVARVCLAVATLARPVPARGADGEDREVDVVILLASPAGENRAMLGVLARLVRAARNGDLGGRLRTAGSRPALAAVLAAVDAWSG